jgi:hypothetical protein
VGPTHELITLAAPQRWRAALSGLPHGHAHTWRFCHAVQLTSQLPTYLYRYRRGDVQVACPLAVRELDGYPDVVTPYGFGGFTRTGDWGRFPAEWTEFARSRGWVCGYLALNPLLCEPDGFPDADVHVHNRLYALDLRGSEQALLGRLSENRRRELREWPSARARLEHDRERLTRFLLDTYADFFARRGAGRASDFRRETMVAIASLDDVFLVGAGEGGRIEAVAMFGHTSRCGDYLFNVSLPGGERHAVYLVWAAVERLRELGVEWLNLGGGISQDDGVGEFKRRFGARALPLVSLRQIYAPGAYAELCRRTGVTPADGSGYFPPYRAMTAR